MKVTACRALLLCVVGAAVGVHAQTPPPLPKGTNVLLGRVLDMGSDGPVAGAIVTLTGHFDASGKPLATISLEPVPGAPAGRNVFTTAEGYFVFRDLPAGRYSIATRGFGYINTDFPPQVIEITDSGKPLPVELHLWKYAAISGRVIDGRGESVVGMPVSALCRVVTAGHLVLQPEGAAVPTALIDGGSVLRTGEGNRVGDAVLQRAGPQLPLSTEGAPLGLATTLHPGTVGPDQATLITLGSGESRTDVDVPIAFSGIVSVSGVVTGPDGPLKNLTVRLVPPAGDTSDFDGGGLANAVTDNRGAFTFAGVTPGDYVLRTALVAGDFQTGDGVSLWAVQPVSVGDQAVAGLDVTMRQGVRISCGACRT